MKIYVVGSSKNKFLPLDNIREKFLIDQPHEGDNIDFLNPWYCELTGLYYLWKHVNDEIVGLEHYRTYFWKDGHPINETQIKEELKKGDIICGGYNRSLWGSKNLAAELQRCTNTLNPFMETLYKNDAKFADYFNFYLSHLKIWAFNLFIGKKETLNEWLTFFFDVMIDFEKINPIGPATKTNRREGFFAEFMFGAWLEYKGYKIIPCDINKLNRQLTRSEIYCKKFY